MPVLKNESGTAKPNLKTQVLLNDVVRDLDLPKNNVQLWGLR